MFVGHGVLAFALTASAAAYYGWDDERALAIGAIAGLFATLPDVDVLYALTGVLNAEISGTESFWTVTNELHRGVTHSLVIGSLAAVGFAAWRRREDRRLGAVAVVLLGAIVVLGIRIGPGVGAVLAAFVVAGLWIVAAAASLRLGSRAVLATAAVGLVTHPFGDLLTGSAPSLLFPVGLLSLTRVSLHPDPTVHLLGAVLVELTVVWTALFVAVRLGSETRIRDQVRPRALLGVGYAVAVLVVPTPTLETAAPFVMSVLGVGAITTLPRATRPRLIATAATGLTAITLALFGYAGAYAILSPL